MLRRYPRISALIRFPCRRRRELSIKLRVGRRMNLYLRPPPLVRVRIPNLVRINPA